MQKTTNYGLKKPGTNEFYKIGDFNDNADIIDAKMKEIEGKSDTVKTTVTAHTSNKSNPHGVTAAQVGALPAGTIESGTFELKFDDKVVNANAVYYKIGRIVYCYASCSSATAFSKGYKSFTGFKYPIKSTVYSLFKYVAHWNYGTDSKISFVSESSVTAELTAELPANQPFSFMGIYLTE